MIARFDDFEIDTMARELRKSGRRVRLQDKPFQLLQLLVERPAEVISRNDVRHCLWPDDTFVDFDQSINSAVKKLRIALGDSADRPRYLETVPRRGYRFLVTPRVVSESKAREKLATRPTRAAFGRGVLVGIGGVVVLLALWAYRFREAPSVVEIDRVVQLTREPGLEVDPAISPDGSMIAYASGRANQLKIQVQQIAGGRELGVTQALPGSHRSPQWSPDGTHIAFQRILDDASDILMIPALGGTPRTLIPSQPGPLAVGFAFSPDGRHVAYVSGLERDAIYIQSIDGLNRRKIAEGLEIFPLSWSPDGAWIAFGAGNLGYVRGHQFTNLAPSSIWIVPAEGGDRIRVTEEVYLDHSPVWAPDGRHLLFVSDRNGSRDIHRVAIARDGTVAAANDRFTSGLQVHTLSLSAAGKHLAYSVLPSAQNIWALDIPTDDEPVSTAVATPVTVEHQIIEGIDVSPDGDWLVYDTNKGGTQDIYKTRIRGGDAIPVTTGDGDDFLPAWSPDGRDVAYHALRNGNRDIYVVPADGGTPRQITTDAAQDRRPDWSPDGTELVFHSDRSGVRELYVTASGQVESEGSKPRQLTFDGGVFGKWSPDGRWIAYQRGRFTPHSSLALISPDGSETRVLVEEGGNIYAIWGDAGETLYYRVIDEDGGSNIWSIAATGGQPTLLVRGDDQTRFSARYEFASDGNQFFFTMSEPNADIWMMTLASAP